MYHHVARTRHGLLFESWEQAAALWTRITRAIPGMEALCLMPNHVHLQHERDVRLLLGRVLGGHSRALHWESGLRGRLLEPLPTPTVASDAQKRRRDTRYIHLNPCRAGMVSDPLEWPWSTYRDAVGLTLSPARRRASDPHALHRYTSADPSVQVDGTLLPIAQATPSLLDLQAAVSAATRVPLVDLRTRGPARQLWIRSALALTAASPVEIADFVQVSRWTVQRCPRGESPAVALVERLAGDPRFPGIPSGPGHWSRSVRWRRRHGG
ncbi:MAG: hypothetical protein VX899_09400 [Myxococcota bacterium]|nr:hypothetical protein [Myxococcota bacterium]